jgi:hypothetical protein
MYDGDLKGCIGLLIERSLSLRHQCEELLLRLREIRQPERLEYPTDHKDEERET